MGIFINHRRTDGYSQKHVITLGTGTVGTTALLTILCLIAAGVAIVDQRVQVIIGDQVDTAANTTITTIWPTFRDKFFPAKTYAAVATFACFHMNVGFINKLHSLYLRTGAAFTHTYNATSA